MGAKLYIVRVEMMEESIHTAFLVFYAQHTIAMAGRLEFMPTWITTWDAMDILGFLETLKNATYSFEGSWNYSRNRLIQDRATNPWRTTRSTSGG